MTRTYLRVSPELVQAVLDDERIEDYMIARAYLECADMIKEATLSKDLCVYWDEEEEL